MEAAAKSHKLILTALIIEDVKTKTFIGTFKEIEGVTVQGNSQEEVFALLPKALDSIFSVKRELTSPDYGKNQAKIVEKELALCY